MPARVADGLGIVLVNVGVNVDLDVEVPTSTPGSVSSASAVLQCVSVALCSYRYFKAVKRKCNQRASCTPTLAKAFYCATSKAYCSHNSLWPRHCVIRLELIFFQ